MPFTNLCQAIHPYWCSVYPTELSNELYSILMFRISFPDSTPSSFKEVYTAPDVPYTPSWPVYLSLWAIFHQSVYAIYLF